MNTRMTTKSQKNNPDTLAPWRQGVAGPIFRLTGFLIVGSWFTVASAEENDLAAGPQFVVSEDTLLGSSDVSVNKHGEFLIAYDQLTLSADGTRVGPGDLFAQQYDRAGQASGAPFKINKLTLGNPATPAVALHHKGHSVVTWNGALLPGAALPDIWARQFDAAGEPVGDEFRANTFVPGIHGQPDVAMDDLGNFVITWTQTPSPRGTNNVAQDGSGSGVFARRYNWQGVPLGDEFPVHSITNGNQTGSRVAMDHLGNFVVAWTSPDGVRARRFDRSGIPHGKEFLVNQHGATANNHVVRGVASDAAGRFAVLWVGAGPETDGGGVYVRLFDETGAPRTSQLRISPVTTLPFASRPGAAISVEKKGSFVVTWDHNWNSSAPGGISGQVFDPDGAALTDVFEIGTPGGLRLNNGSVGLNKHGRLLASWLSSGLAPSPVWAVSGQFFEVSLPGNPGHAE
jgi:hypothetical protein